MGKLSHVDSENEQYGYKPLTESEEPNRLDLNNLLKRIKDEKTKSRKLNIGARLKETIRIVKVTGERLQLVHGSSSV